MVKIRSSLEFLIFHEAKERKDILQPLFSRRAIIEMQDLVHENQLEPFATFKHFSLTRKLVMGLPSWVSIRVSPKTSGLVHLQQILGKQVVDICKNPKLLDDTPHKIMKHKLLRLEANKERPGVLSTLLRIDPPLGAIISSAFIPGGDAIDMQIIAGMSGTLVHDAETIFLYANPFQPRSLA
ncbi:hypothetical protein GX48_02133 [Paracoccidioides brasiliensis]|nr:hypothetical protein GX48_02133 [Paracoccidioides brasiliensis]